MKLSAILTVFNRKEKTLNCLTSLFNITHDIDVYLVDDGSTDGTWDAVKEKFPQVNLIKGNGNLFWSRGMYTAWKEAVKGDYDAYIWLNDDQKLRSNFLEELFSVEQENNWNCIVTGRIADIESGEIIYCGYDNNKKLLTKIGEIEEVTHMNGNVVCIPKSVVNKIGIIDPYYHHDLGDGDYGLRSRENGIKVLTTRNIVADGYRNDVDRLRKWGVSLKQRFKYLYSPLGSNPNINFYYRKKHFGIVHAVAFYCYQIVSTILPDCIVQYGKSK